MRPVQLTGSFLISGTFNTSNKWALRGNKRALEFVYLDAHAIVKLERVGVCWRTVLLQNKKRCIYIHPVLYYLINDTVGLLQSSVILNKMSWLKQLCTWVMVLIILTTKRDLKRLGWWLVELCLSFFFFF